MTGYSLSLLDAQLEEIRAEAAASGLPADEVVALLRMHADAIEQYCLDPDELPDRDESGSAVSQTAD